MKNRGASVCAVCAAEAPLFVYGTKMLPAGVSDDLLNSTLSNPADIA